MYAQRAVATTTIAMLALIALPLSAMLALDTTAAHPQQLDLEDWGDAPSPYPSYARHMVGVQPVLWLGAPLTPPDTEASVQPHPSALGDDLAGIDDEGSVTIPLLVSCQNAVLSVETSASDGILNAWIDYNDDGDWMEPSEHIFASYYLASPGMHYLPTSVPCSAMPTQQTFARFRLSSGPTSFQDLPSSPAPIGEIEDHAVVIQGPDLSIVKSDSPDPAETGDVLVYSLLVTNLGPVTEPAALVSDTVPLSLTVLSAQPGQGTCSVQERAVRCDLGSLPVSATAEVTISARVGGGISGQITNSAYVEGAGPDPAPANNSASETTTIEQQGLDVQLLKSDLPDPVWALDPLTYTLQVINGGTELATNVRVTDTLPSPGVDYTNTVATPSQGACGPMGQPEFECALGDIPTGQSATVIVETPRVTIIPTHYGVTATITNTAGVVPDLDERAPENNYDTETTAVVSPCVEVLLVIDDSGSMGGSDIPGGPTRIDDAKQAGQAFVSIVDSTVTKVGVEWFNHFAHLVHQLSRDMWSVSDAISNIPEPEPDGSTAIATAIIVARNELTGPRHNALAKQVMILLSDGSSNYGPPPNPEANIAKAMGIRIITIGLGAGADQNALRAIASSPSDYHYAPTSGELEEIYRQLGEGVCEPPPPPPGNPQVDLAITKTDDPYDPSPLCGVVTYTLTVYNLTRDAVATDVRVTDTLPVSTTFLGSLPGEGTSPPRCGFAPATRQVTCELGNLNGDASSVVKIWLRLSDPLASPPPASMLNHAQTRCDNPETKLSNNEDDETTLLSLGDLALTKAADPGNLSPPGWITYTVLVTSTNECDNPSVTVTDTLPAELAYRGASTTRGTASYSPTMHAVLVDLGTMTTTAASVLVTGTVPCTTTGVLTNTAIVRGDAPEVTLANNEDSAATSVQAARCSDLGDTPDRWNHTMSPMYAFPGVLANYPTVFERSGLMPPGPKHKRAKDDAWLGSAVSGEADADLNPDEDPGTNISPPVNIANRDGLDDGVLPPPLPGCGPMVLSYDVTVSDLLGFAPRTRYTNVWFDFNRDGDFADSFICTPPGGQPQTVLEWAVQNAVTVLPPGHHALSTPGFTATSGPPGTNVWMRISISNTPAPILGGDGRGPMGGYEFGETEDYLVASGGQYVLQWDWVAPSAVTLLRWLQTVFSNSAPPHAVRGLH